MIHADCPPGVAAGKLDTTVQSLRQALHQYRAELTRSEAAFTEFELRWSQRQREIDAHLALIERQLHGAAASPVLGIIHPDE